MILEAQEIEQQQKLDELRVSGRNIKTSLKRLEAREHELTTRISELVTEENDLYNRTEQLSERFGI